MVFKNDVTSALSKSSARNAFTILEYLMKRQTVKVSLAYQETPCAVYSIKILR
jgi:hypothetical protein